CAEDHPRIYRLRKAPGSGYQWRVGLRRADRDINKDSVGTWFSAVGRGTGHWYIVSASAKGRSSEHLGRYTKQSAEIGGGRAANNPRGGARAGVLAGDFWARAGDARARFRFLNNKQAVVDDATGKDRQRQECHKERNLDRPRARLSRGLCSISQTPDVCQP